MKKVKINIQFKIDCPIHVELPDDMDLDKISVEDFENMAFENRDEEADRFYQETFEAYCTQVTANNFDKRFNTEV